MSDVAVFLVGLATTLAPEVDWVPSVLKVAKKTGAMSKGLAEHIVKLAKAGRQRELMPLFHDVRRVAGRASRDEGGVLAIAPMGPRKAKRIGWASAKRRVGSAGAAAEPGCTRPASAAAMANEMRAATPLLLRGGVRGR